MGLFLIWVVRSVENKTENKGQKKIRENKGQKKIGILFVVNLWFCLFVYERITMLQIWAQCSVLRALPAGLPCRLITQTHASGVFVFWKSLKLKRLKARLWKLWSLSQFNSYPRFVVCKWMISFTYTGGEWNGAYVNAYVHARVTVGRQEGRGQILSEQQVMSQALGEALLIEGACFTRVVASFFIEEAH